MNNMETEFKVGSKVRVMKVNEADKQVELHRGRVVGLANAIGGGLAWVKVWDNGRDSTDASIESAEYYPISSKRISVISDEQKKR